MHIQQLQQPGEVASCIEWQEQHYGDGSHNLLDAGVVDSKVLLPFEELEVDDLDDLAGWGSLPSWDGDRDHHQLHLQDLGS